MRNSVFVAMALVLTTIVSCKSSGPGIFGKKSPHEQYGIRLENAGLKKTALGTAWFRAAEQSLATAININLPYQEAGYFSAERPHAMALRFSARRGQKLAIRLNKKPVTNFNLYIDLWTINTASASTKYVASSDTLKNSIEYEVDDDESFVLRIQPELLASGEYTLTITAGPSLAYPIQAPGKNHIKSFWGADRDGGSRQHEGIDMFAAKRTPVVAASDGIVTRVNESNLGGKVVWMRTKDRNYSLYYAHLDTQLVDDGQRVIAGDTLGLMGNTGNAKFTAPHLHFGIYTIGGAIDPLAFVQPVDTVPEKVDVSKELFGKRARNSGKASLRMDLNPNTPVEELEPNSVFIVDGGTSSLYKVSLPDGRSRFVMAKAVHQPSRPIRTFTTELPVDILDKPDTLAAKKTSIPAGEPVSILGGFSAYYFVSSGDVTGWIRK